MSGNSFNKGFISTILAFSLWGILPLYWHVLISIDPLHILALRIIMSLVLVCVILLAQRNIRWIVILKEPKKLLFLILTAIFLSCNWGIYIWAVNMGHTLDASLGYYINPLVSVVLGLIFYRERLRPIQWAAVALAFVGVTLLTVLSGSLPWVSLSLAFTFGIYGLLKKKSPLSALESLGAETLVSVPIAFFLLFFTFSGGISSSPAFTGIENLTYLGKLPAHILILLSLCGLISALPLYFFAQGAKQLPLSTLGFIQFISPTIQFVLGLFIFGESFPIHHIAAFAVIWAAVIIYIVSLRAAASRGKE